MLLRIPAWLDAKVALCSLGRLSRGRDVKSGALTRADLAEAVHREVGLTRQDGAQLVERMLDLVVEALGRGEEVKLSGFGVFQVRAKRARMGRNPKTGEPAAIDPRRVISFRASQVMKARVGKAVVS
jgi:integration host factor subunit alpha